MASFNKAKKFISVAIHYCEGRSVIARRQVNQSLQLCSSFLKQFSTTETVFDTRLYHRLTSNDLYHFLFQNHASIRYIPRKKSHTLNDLTSRSLGSFKPVKSDVIAPISTTMHPFTHALARKPPIEKKKIQEPHLIPTCPLSIPL